MSRFPITYTDPVRSRGTLTVVRSTFTAAEGGLHIVAETEGDRAGVWISEADARDLKDALVEHYAEAIEEPPVFEPGDVVLVDPDAECIYGRTFGLDERPASAARMKVSMGRPDEDGDLRLVTEDDGGVRYARPEYLSPAPAEPAPSTPETSVGDRVLVTRAAGLYEPEDGPGFLATVTGTFRVGSAHGGRVYVRAEQGGTWHYAGQEFYADEWQPAPAWAVGDRVLIGEGRSEEPELVGLTGTIAKAPSGYGTTARVYPDVPPTEGAWRGKDEIIVWTRSLESLDERLPECFESVTITPALKAGDRVRVISDACNRRDKVGAEGTVDSRVGDTVVRVLLDDGVTRVRCRHTLALLPPKEGRIEPPKIPGTLADGWVADETWDSLSPALYTAPPEVFEIPADKEPRPAFRVKEKRASAHCFPAGTIVYPVNGGEGGLYSTDPNSTAIAPEWTHGGYGPEAKPITQYLRSPETDLEPVSDYVAEGEADPQPPTDLDAYPNGARVRVLAPEAYGAEVSEGDLGTVVEIDEDGDLFVVMDNGSDDGDGWVFRPGIDVEPIEAPPAFRVTDEAGHFFKIGTVVYPAVAAEPAWDGLRLYSTRPDYEGVFTAHDGSNFVAQWLGAEQVEPVVAVEEKSPVEEAPKPEAAEPLSGEALKVGAKARVLVDRPLSAVLKKGDLVEVTGGNEDSSLLTVRGEDGRSWYVHREHVEPYTEPHACPVCGIVGCTILAGLRG